MTKLQTMTRRDTFLFAAVGASAAALVTAAFPV